MKKALLTLTLVAAAAGAHANNYAIDPNHTFVTFEIDHYGTTTNRGRFEDKEGTITFDRAAKTGRVDLTIKTESIDTGTDAFDKHLKSKDFLNVGQFPTAKFVGEKFSFNGDKVSEVAGSLTLLGKTQPVTLKATKFNCYQHPLLKREVCGGDFETVIQRSQFGMNWGLEFGAADNVKLIVQVEAIRQ